MLNKHITVSTEYDSNDTPGVILLEFEWGSGTIIGRCRAGFKGGSEGPRKWLLLMIDAYETTTT